MERTISVIIPTYNRPHLLREALESVQKQEYSNIEIIVIDDNSWEATSSLVSAFPGVVFLRNEKNMGCGFSRKKGFEYCHGDYIVFLDDDDYYTDEFFFRKCIEILQERKDAVFVTANAIVSEEATGKCRDYCLNDSGWRDGIDYLREFNLKKASPLSTFPSVFSKEMLLKVGVHDMEMVNDMALYMRALTQGCVYFLADKVGVYRIHSSNISKKITGSFIISNLEEKLDIYKIIRNNSLFEEYNQWWMEQLKTTVSYYVYGSHPNLSDFNEVRKWCIKNSNAPDEVKAQFKVYQDYLVDYRICAVKRRIKKVLGMK